MRLGLLECWPGRLNCPLLPECLAVWMNLLALVRSVAALLWNPLAPKLPAWEFVAARLPGLANRQARSTAGLAWTSANRQV